MTDSKSNLVLAGFMASGKTTVGRSAAKRMGRRFIDMDTVLVERLGAPIADVFARRGEAYFRQAERQLCEELSQPSGAVIAAGGGAIVDVDNRLSLSRGGLLVCLTCSPEETLKRIADPSTRPMLTGGDPAVRIAELMSERSAVYEAIARQIDTTHMPVQRVAEAAIAAYEGDSRPQIIPVQHNEGSSGGTNGGSYDIVFGHGSLSAIGEIAAARGLTGKVAVITNTTVGPLWAATVVGSLKAARFEPHVFEIADGEAHKTLQTVAHLYDGLAEAGFERGEAVLALGGGVVGDVAGFVAATYLRGVPLLQAPTTVLSMVDSSVGGKVGVDHPCGKNLVGAFKQPVVVVADLATLLSLPAAERRSGLAEVIKHGLIAAPDILDHVETALTPDLAGLLPPAIRVKVEIVQLDPYERGRRAELNLGHTFGHALENLSGYRMRHGEAVSIGMVAACRVAERLGVCAPGLAGRMEGILRKVGLPVRYQDYTPEAIWAAMGSDKKRKAGRLRFVLPVRPGEMLVTDDVPRALVLEVMKELGEK